ncbi:MAG: hypothetical protein MJ148_01855 [Clostridia bacterium]|nr:hypothetical protein [Clostridia bacterium]
MSNFWDYEVWGLINLVGVLLISLIIGNVLKKVLPFLQATMIPTSVIGGVILIIISSTYKVVTGNVMFDQPFFGGNGTAVLETITYHSLALGFIAATFKTTEGVFSKERQGEIFNTGITTVATYIIQAIFGLAVSIIAAKVVEGFFPAAGALLPFGYGQGTGQALNFGGVYEEMWGFDGGKSFGLTIAALGFISAALGGVLYINIQKKRGKINVQHIKGEKIEYSQIQSKNEIPMQDSLDKITVQFAFIGGTYLLTYLIMFVIGSLAPGARSIVYGFNFLIAVLCTTLVKYVLNRLRLKRIVRKQFINNFLMTRLSNFFYDLMIVAGVAAIRLSTLERYWGVIIIMGLGGAIITYKYNLFIAKKMFPGYVHEQFLTMYGMLTGTASTGIILLREIDPAFESPASDNLVFQNFIAMVFGVPMMLFANLAPEKTVLTLIICVAYFIVLNIILFRKSIFKGKKRQ